MAATQATIYNIDGYTHSARSGDHVITVDEPERLGGADKGMTPMELLLAAMGSCTAITVRMYAQRKGWQLGDIEVKVERIDDADEPTVDIFIRMDGDLDNDQVQRIHNIAEKCPVVRTVREGLTVRKTACRVIDKGEDICHD